MKISDFNIVEQLKKSNFWLTAIAVDLTIIQLSLHWKFSSSVDALFIKSLFWASIVYLIAKKQHTLNLESDLFSTLIGLLLIALTLIKSLSLFWFESSFIKFSALLSFLGLALIASGIKGLKQYWQEFIIMVLSFDGILLSLLPAKFDISILSAKAANFVLWYLGFPVYRQGINVILPTGAIEIYPGCSGLNAMLILLQLSLIFILVFPINIFQKFLLPITAVFLAFFINIFRLVLMTLLVAASNDQGFKYWHGEPGNQIFSTISILAFGFICHWILKEKKPV
ncbi:cyanoexosortase A [Nostoc sp. 106C]|uniref:cyanoexosortase A n=1 Tax=Nostoc sp. 106C TaxID=1932667 RepID=UPI000A3819A2|nr:cyanoexosortase A [Nostoc sp. 106C]